MKCINCGNEIQESVEFCPVCGANLVASNQAPVSSNANEVMQNVNNNLSSENEGQANTQYAASFGDTYSVNGEKIGSSAPVIAKKKVNKGLIIAIVLILLVLIGCGTFGYFYEFKSADKRIEIISKNLFNFTSKIKNDKVELASGTYEISGKFSSGDELISTSLNGKYAVDLKNEILDFTINATSLNVGQELLPTPLNLELYLNDSKAYLLLQNFYDKYIYMEVPEIDEIFDNTAENDINYVVLVSGLKTALINSLKALKTEQKIADVTINGKTSKANVITIVDTASNERIFNSTFFRSLANNQAFVAEAAKVFELSEEKTEEKLLAYLEEQEYEGNNESRIEIYSPLFGNDLLGIRLIENDKETNDNYIFDIYPIDDGYHFNGEKNGKDILKLDVKSNVEVNSKTTISKISIDLMAFVEDTTYKLNLDFNVTEDINPKVEKVNVKNSVNVQYLTEEDIQTITNNMYSYGSLGLYLQEYIGSLIS